MDAARERGDRTEIPKRLFDELAPCVAPVPRDDDGPLADEGQERPRGRRPVHRIPIAERGRGAVLEQVPGAQDVGVRDPDHDVVVGVAAAEVVEQDLAPVEVDDGAIGERAVGRVEDDVGEVGGERRHAGRNAGALGLPEASDHRHAPLVTPDDGRAEDCVAEAVVEVAVRVDDDADAGRAELAQVVEDLACLGRGAARVHDEGGATAEHGDDVLVEECVAAHEDAVADLGPGAAHAANRSGGRRGGLRSACTGGASPMTDAPVVPFEATARMADGTTLRTLRWPPPGDAWATALVVHGLGEHGGRYGNVAAPLTAAGLDVHAYDHRGFGGSAGRRAYVDDWSVYHDDLEERLSALRAEHPDRVLVLYGHSMGGLIATGYVLSDRPRPAPDLLVLSSPALEASIPAWKRSIAGGLTRVVPRMRMSNGELGDQLSHDPAVSAAYVADPLCYPSTTVRLAHEAMLEQARLRKVIAALDRMPMPTYVFHGSADPIVPVSASEAIGRLGNVTRHVHEGLRHETHHESEHEHVIAEVVAWLTSQRPPGIASPPAPAPEAVGAEV